MIIPSFYLLCFPSSEQTEPGAAESGQQLQLQRTDGGARLTALAFECLVDGCGSETAAVAVHSCLICQVRTMSLQARLCSLVWCF